MENLSQKEEQTRKDAQELLLAYAQDIINAWPTMTIRTISQMTSKVESLKQALELLKIR